MKKLILTILPALVIAAAALVATSGAAEAGHANGCPNNTSQLRGNYGYGPEYRFWAHVYCNYDAGVPEEFRFVDTMSIVTFISPIDWTPYLRYRLPPVWGPEELYDIASCGLPCVKLGSQAPGTLSDGIHRYPHPSYAGIICRRGHAVIMVDVHEGSGKVLERLRFNRYSSGICA